MPCVFISGLYSNQTITVMSTTKASRLTIYISNTDKFKHTSLYEMLVFSAKRYHLAGVTVTKGVMGFGKSSRVYSSKLWELNEKLPVKVEMIDTTEKINHFRDEILLPWMEKISKGCLITQEEVDIILLEGEMDE